MSERFKISKDGGFIFDNMTDDFLDIEDACTSLNNFSNYLIYPITNKEVIIDGKIIQKEIHIQI